jgi:deoxyadenosine kinase
MSDIEKLYISISGLIGAGKSTLARALGEALNLEVYYEPVHDNEYLADFYGNMEKYSFPMQIYLLNKRFQQQQQIVWQRKGAVQDRTIYEDRIFAKMLCDQGLMEKRDFETYSELFSNMSNFMCRPNLIIHLDVTPEESLRRIKMRERDCETTITVEYLRALHAEYEVFLKDISRVIPVLRVNYSEFKTAEEMAEMVKKEYKSLINIRNIE